MVQRYELEEMSRNPFESYRCLEENDEGDWVKYEDYAALEKLYRAAIEHMVAVHQRYNSDAGPALQKLYELSGKDE